MPDFKELIEKNGKQLELSFKHFYSSTQRGTYTSENIRSINFKFDGALFTSVMRCLDITLEGDYSSVIAKDDAIKNLTLTVSDSAGNSQSIEYGTFYVASTPEYDVDTNLTQLCCYDEMYKAMKPYDLKSITFPISLKDYLKAICIKLNFSNANSINYSTLVNGNKMIYSDPYIGVAGETESAYLYRDVLDEIARCAGCSFAFKSNANGDVPDNLNIIYVTDGSGNMKPSLYTLDESNFKSLTIGEEYGVINTVIYSRQPQEDNVFKSTITNESLSYNRKSVKLKQPEIADDTDDNKRLEWLTPILNKVKGLHYFCYELESFGIGYLNFGDVITIESYARTGNVIDFEAVRTYQTVFMRCDMMIDTNIKESSKLEMPVATATDYSAAKSATDKALRQTFLKVDKQLGEIRGLITDTEKGLKNEFSATASSLRGEISDSVNGLRNEFSATTDAINASLSDSVNGLRNEFSATTSSLSSRITDEVNGLQTQITANTQGVSLLTSKVEDMKIGSRNMLIDSACFETRTHSAYYVTKGNTSTGNEATLPSGKFREFTIIANSTNSRRGLCFKTESAAAPLGNVQSIKPQTTYTLTFWAKINAGEKTLSSSDLVSVSYGVTAVTLSSLVLNDTWKQYRYTFKTRAGTSANSSFQIRFYFPMTESEEIILYLSSLQLEESTIPSDWHKNDADLAAEYLTDSDFAGLLDSSIGSYLTEYVKSSTIESLRTEFNTGITQTQKEIALKADSTTVANLTDKVNNQATLIANNTAAIETKASQILSTVSSTYYLKTSATTLESNLKTYTDNAKSDAKSYADSVGTAANNYADGVGATIFANAKSYIDQQADSIKIAVEKNIKVGAVNLLYNAECFYGYQETYYRSSKNTGYPEVSTETGVPSKMSNHFYYKCTTAGNEVGVYFRNNDTNRLLACNLAEILPNEKYTFSFWAKGGSTTNGRKLSRVYLLNFGSGINVNYDTDLCDELSLGSTWKRYRVTFSIDKAPTTFEIRFWHTGTVNTNYTTYISSLKLESGSVLTDWDLNGLEYAYASEIEMLQNAINLRVTSSDVESQIAASIEMCVKTDENGVVQSEIAMTANRVSIDSTNFKLTKAGKITATSGTIGGWTITSSSLYIKDGNNDIITKLSDDGKITSGTSTDNQVIVENGHLDFYYGGTRSFRLGQTANNGFSLEDKNNSPRFAVYPITQWGNSNISSDYRTVVAASGGFVITANYGNNALVLEGASVRLCGAVTAYSSITATGSITTSGSITATSGNVNAKSFSVSSKVAMQVYGSEFVIGVDAYPLGLYAKSKITCHATLYNASGVTYKTNSLSGITTETDAGEIVIPDNFMEYFENSEVSISPSKYCTTQSYVGDIIIHEDEETGETWEEQVIVPESTTKIEKGVDFISRQATPDILLDDEGVDMFSMMCLTWKGVQNLHERLTAIENSLK